MKLLITLTLALAPRAHANGRLTRYARNSSYSTSHPGRCDRNVFERQFYDLAKGLEPTSDKVTAHSYETMYGTFVYPLKFAAHPPRILEIGLGCNMDYGPGASVKARSGVGLRSTRRAVGSSTRSRTTSPSSTANWRPASSASAIATSRVVVRVSQGTTSRGGAEE